MTTTTTLKRIPGRPKGTGGRPGKGRRSMMAARAPEEQAEHYFALASELGLPLSDWIVLTLAESTGLPVPQYILAEVDAFRRSQDQDPLAVPVQLSVAS